MFNLKKCSVYAVNLLAMILFEVSIYLNLKIQAFFLRWVGVCVADLCDCEVFPSCLKVGVLLSERAVFSESQGAR